MTKWQALFGMMNRDSPIVVGDVVAGLGCLGAKFVDVLDWFKHFLGLIS